MKALMPLLFFCFSVIFFTQKHKIANETTIDSHTIFGRHSLDCKGRGLCSFTTENISLSKVNSKIDYTQSSISLIVYRDKITQEDEIKIVGNLLTKNSNLDSLTFTMYDDFELNAIQLVNSNTNQIASIPKGNYPIKVTKNTFSITFNLD